METILVVGGGPAGAAAAIAALSEGAAVRIVERSRQPKHKVCGEFLSPEAFHILDLLGGGGLAGPKPAPIRKCLLRFGDREKRWNLPEPAFGLSRFELDRLLLEKAGALGANICRGECGARGLGNGGPSRIVLAAGRTPSASRQNRLFGFKAHFEGPTDDAVELFFMRQGYVGVSPIENGWTNVCGIAPESALHRHGFDVDEHLAAFPPLAERLRPLRRRMGWLMVGPLSYSPPVTHSDVNERLYPAGDALGFVDPFTGSGILNALFTGRMAGFSAARAVPSRDYIRECQSLLNRPFGISALLRKLLEWDCVYYLAALTPGRWLFQLTRARLSGSAG
ncbi:MAG: FAD-dependent monooxygenase [Acidobacteriia bacterium]|nr:FAD-dependent monooxygenase [Terriglobia bacterium]